MPNLTLTDLLFLSPTTGESVAQKFLEPLNAALPNNPVTAAMFVAQVLHESAGFVYQEEIASGAAYEGRKDLGNTQPGDGRRFKGRGLIQITGRDNYLAYGEFAGVDFISNPKLMASLPYCVSSAKWFWDSKGCEALAQPGTEEAFRAVTKRINGGYTGYSGRKQYWLKAKKLFKGEI